MVRLETCESLESWDTRSLNVCDRLNLFKFGWKQQTKVVVKKSPGSSLPKKSGPRFADLCTASWANLKDLFVLVSWNILKRIEDKFQRSIFWYSFFPHKVSSAQKIASSRNHGEPQPWTQKERLKMRNPQKHRNKRNLEEQRKLKSVPRLSPSMETLDPSVMKSWRKYVRTDTVQKCSESCWLLSVFLWHSALYIFAWTGLVHLKMFRNRKDECFLERWYPLIPQGICSYMFL